MSIQRFVIGADHLVPAEQAEGVWESPAEVVLYADHVAALDEAFEEGYKCGHLDTATTYRKDERARIRQAVEGIANDDYCYDYDCRMKAKFLSIIDGTADA